MSDSGVVVYWAVLIIYPRVKNKTVETASSQKKRKERDDAGYMRKDTLNSEMKGEWD